MLITSTSSKVSWESCAFLFDEALSKCGNDADHFLLLALQHCVKRFPRKRDGKMAT